MKILVCDICGGEIEILPGGAKGQCASCGLSYSLDRIKEIYSDMKLRTSDSAGDVNRLKALLTNYLNAENYIAAEITARILLSAAPDDEQTKELYLKLQDRKYYLR